MRKIVDINKIYPDKLETKNYKIFKSIWTKDKFDYFINPEKKPTRDNFKDSYPLRHLYLQENINDLNKEFTYLYHNIEKNMMSNHTLEIVTCNDFLENASGDILNFGLGLGIILYPLLDDPTVKSIVVVEKDYGLIEVISPFLFERDRSKKLTIIHDDAFDFYKTLNKKFDTIFFDIWPSLSLKTIPEMENLHNLYRKNLKNENSFMTSWCYNDMKKYFNLV